MTKEMLNEQITLYTKQLGSFEQLSTKIAVTIMEMNIFYSTLKNVAGISYC